MNFKERLIEVIKKNDFLYNPKSPFYKDTRRKAIAWEKIATRLNSNVPTCKKTWKYLRDSYARSNRNKRVNLQSGSGHNVQWKYYDQLLFLENIILPKKNYKSSGKHKYSSESEKEDSVSKANQKFYDIFIESVLSNGEKNEPVINFEGTEDLPLINEETEDVELNNFNYVEEEDNKPNNIFNIHEIKEKNETHFTKQEKVTSSESENNFYKNTFSVPQKYEMTENQLFFTAIAKKVERLPINVQEDLQIEILNIVTAATRNVRENKSA